MIEQHPKLSTPIQFVKGVGERLAKQLNALGIRTVYDALFHLPTRYVDRRHNTRIIHIESGATVFVVSQLTDRFKMEEVGKRKLVKAIVTDQSAELELVWFNQKFILKRLKEGMGIVATGKVTRNEYTNKRQMIVQDYELYPSASDALRHGKRIVPIYPLTGGLTNKKCAELMQRLITQYLPLLQDYHSRQFCKEHELMDLGQCLKILHHPSQSTTIQEARNRIIFDELFFLQLPYIMRREKFERSPNRHPLVPTGALTESYITQLPYTLTADQNQVVEDIKKDVRGEFAMNRLVQGDVGSGKTDVAIMALLMAVQSGKKGAMLVPTEILAVQHHMKLRERLGSLGVEVYLIKGKMTKAERAKSESIAASDSPCIIVGTHAIIEDPIKLKHLGLVIIDEQHRFGVIQRLKLQQKGLNPHSLFLTATPIPRSLILTVYGDLDKSIITSLPPGRVPPKTYFTSSGRIKDVYDFCRGQIEKGKQVFVVFPLVQESEKLDLKAAETGAEELRQFFPPDSVALIHGKLKADDKQRIMQEFRDRKSHILAATTVIEVGIDIPNANTIIIMDAQRFGLSQLHQLRGRVGRDKGESHCFLIGDPKTTDGKKRINAMLKTGDGFKLAEYDLSIRGPGDMLGTRQAGESSLSMANFITHEKQLIQARDAAFSVLKHDPKLTSPDNALIRHRLETTKAVNFTRELN